MAKKKRREQREVPLEDLKQGPIRHKKGLTPLLEEIARAIFAKVGHFVYPTFEQWELGFMRDMHPWREIVIWENIARTFDLYVAEHPEAADDVQIVGTIVSISTGQVSENETEIEIKLRNLYQEAFIKRWIPLIREPFEFPLDEAIVLEYADIVDKWNDGYFPNLRGKDDCRRMLADADIILGMDASEESFVIFGGDRLEAGRIPKGLKTLIVSVDAEKPKELGVISILVKCIKGVS